MNLQNKLLNKLVIGVLFMASQSVMANLNIFTCEPEWESLVKEIGGDKVEVFSATTGLQDPHHIQARPSLIAKVRKVDMVVCTGAELEIGWLPLLIRRAANPKIQEAGPGYFMATQYARILGRPKTLDRSQGDVHAAGNPHIQTNPKNILPVAKALTVRMTALDPENGQLYQNNLDDFEQRWKQALDGWKKLTQPLKNLPIVVYHASWIYLEDYLKLERVDSLEDKPGVPPTSGHLAEILNKMKTHPAKVIIYAAYQDGRPAQWLSEQTGIPLVKLPFTIGGTDEAKDLFSLYDDTFNRLLKTVTP